MLHIVWGYGGGQFEGFCDSAAIAVNCNLRLSGAETTKADGRLFRYVGDSLEAKDTSLELAIAALRADYKKLASRIRVLNKTVKCEHDGITIRLNYPSFRQGSATIPELIDAIAHFLTPFCLPRSETDVVDALYGKIDVGDFKIRCAQLSEEAKDLFKRAQKATNRNGEAGELLLYILTEWILEAPQLIAKMSLKTNPQMPVHGSDGVHVRYDADIAKLVLYWGESKLYADVTSAIKAAVNSIATSLQPNKIKHELNLVKRNISFAGLTEDAKDALLKHLDPFDETYNNRIDIITCLIGFDFDGFGEITAADGDKAETKFATLFTQKLTELAPVISAAIKKSKLDEATIEMFFFPMPSAQVFRDLFQNKIGWSS